MEELKKRQKLKRLLYSIPSLGLLLILTVLLGKGGIRLLVKERESAGLVKALETKATTLTERETELEEGIAKLKTAEGITEEIKQKFSVERAGEHVAVIVDERPKVASTTIAGPIWYKKLWDAIIGR